MRKGFFPMNLQFFAASDNGGGSGEKSNADQGAGGSQNTNQGEDIGFGSQSIDYAKIQKMLDGTLAAKEDTALKAYFKQQGLSQQEVEQAISDFKAEKARNHPDVNAVQTQLAQAQSQVQQSQIENAAILEAVSMGIDAKTIPYVLKMADFSQAAGQDGTINKETIKNALNKVIEDVPQLKPQPQDNGGFRQVGGSSVGGSGNKPDDESLKRAFGLL